MKTTIIALLALTGVAVAGTTVTDLSADQTWTDLSYSAASGLFTGTGVTNYEGAAEGAGSNGAITLALDWAALSNLTVDTCIVTLNYDGNTSYSSGENSGIYFKAEDDSIRAWFAGTTNDGGNIADTNEVAGAKQTIGGKDYVILTMRYDDIGADSATKGVSLFTSAAEIYEYWSQGSSNYDQVTSIYVNTDLVKAVTIETGEISDADAKSAVSTLAAALPMTAVPEPTTATLSLLALAGLAARRRRK